MEKIQHSYLNINGLKLHVAHVGEGELGAVLFLHGFPEIWYSWRYQMLAVVEAGFRAIAPDCRGYGLSDQPPEPEKASWADLVADVLAILDSFSISKAFIVGKDFGTRPAYEFAILHPDRVLGVVTLGGSLPPGPFAVDILPKGFYPLRWREPGRAEKDFGRFDVKTVVRNIYILFSQSELQVAKEDQEIMDLVEPSTPLPHWFSEEDLETYSALYEKSHFRYPLEMPYRSLEKATTGIENPSVHVPALLILGEKDYGLKLQGMEDYFRTGMVKHFLPNSKIEFITEGSHFVQEQFPEEVNKLLIAFLKSHI